MGLEARLISDTPPEPSFIGHDPTWGVTRASVLMRGDRRLEAETYLSDGYGKRLAIEARSRGWSPLGELADVWQPSRLRGTLVAPDHGVPFLLAGQMFEVRPVPRKWLSLARTEQAQERFVKAGTVLLSRSGNVGRVTIAHRPHLGKLITDDLLRIDLLEPSLKGWLYAYMRTESFRSMARGAHYGHVVKHLEPAHVAAIPVITIDDKVAEDFSNDVAEIFSARDKAHELTDESEALYVAAVGADLSDVSLDDPFVIRASSLSSMRRRLDAYHHNDVVRRIVETFNNAARSVVLLDDLVERIWWPGRFRRVFGDNGTA
jgi:type I restriction enzyme, S subunit